MSARGPRVWWWFLVPLLTFGLGTPVMVLVGGVRLRSRVHVLAAVGYLLLTIVFFTGVQFTETGRTSLIDAVVLPAFMIPWLGGTAHTAVLQVRVRQAAAAGPGAPVDPALAAAQQRLLRRQEARALLAGNPVLAAELRIGRPDAAGRQYDDGGLVDVNHVPGELLVTELDLPAAAATSVVAERDRLGGFSSPEELLVYCAGMTPDRLELIRDRLVFIPL
jgi:hypothetical protein